MPMSVRLAGSQIDASVEAGMSEQGWHKFLAADGVEDWVVLRLLCSGSRRSASSAACRGGRARLRPRGVRRSVDDRRWPSQRAVDPRCVSDGVAAHRACASSLGDCADAGGRRRPHRRSRGPGRDRRPARCRRCRLLARCARVRRAGRRQRRRPARPRLDGLDAGARHEQSTSARDARRRVRRSRAR